MMKRKITKSEVDEYFSKIEKLNLVDYLNNMAIFFPIDMSSANETSNDVVSMIRPTMTGSSAMVNYGIIIYANSVAVSAALVDLNTAISIDLNAVNSLTKNIHIPEELLDLDCRVIPSNSLLFKIY